jgi:hypothetical protein
MGGRPGTIDIRVHAATVDEALAAVHPDLRAGRYARISFSDTGHGMEAVTLRRIFGVGTRSQGTFASE